jgi:hypothetical protein
MNEQPESRRAQREAAALRIDSATAEVFFTYADLANPYGDDDGYNYGTTGRAFFAVDPNDRIPVLFEDLPAAIRDALWAKRAAADAEGWRTIIGGLYVDEKQPASWDYQSSLVQRVHRPLRSVTHARRGRATTA